MFLKISNLKTLNLKWSLQIKQTNSIPFLEYRFLVILFKAYIFLKNSSINLSIYFLWVKNVPFSNCCRRYSLLVVLLWIQMRMRFELTLLSDEHWWASLWKVPYICHSFEHKLSHCHTLHSFFFSPSFWVCASSYLTFFPQC